MTELGRHFSKFVQFIIYTILKYFLKTPVEGAQTQIMLAIDPNLSSVTGKYFYDCEEHSASSAALNDETAEWLWKKSVELVNL